MEGHREPDQSEPNLEHVVHDHSLEEELASASVEEVEEPLLGGVGSVVPDVTSDEGLLLVEVVLSVPSSPLHLRYSEAFSINKAHVFGVSRLIVLETAS